MTKWKTRRDQGLIGGVALIVFILLIDALLIWLSVELPISFGTFLAGLAMLLSFVFLALIGYWLHGLVGSGYFLDRNAFVIRWGAVEQIIPTSQIERVVLGEQVEGRVRFYGSIWPGHCVGYGEVAGVGPTLFYATVPPRQQVYVVTPGLAYGVSPIEREKFIAALERRKEMGPTQVVEQSSRRPAILDWAIWQDRLAVGMWVGAGLVLLALVGLLCFRFPTLPRVTPLHFNAAGLPDRFEPRGEVFIIPLIGFLTLLFNGVLGGVAYRRERMVSYLLWGGAALVQVLAWVALIGILAHV